METTALAIMCGLPRSGKTTTAKRLESLTPGYQWTRVSPDEIRLALHGEKYLPLAEPFVWAIAEVMARTLLLGDRRVLIDATNITKNNRALWVKLARDFDLPLQIFLVETEKVECMKRAYYTNFDPAIVERMAEQYERPTHDEGRLLRYVVNEGIYSVNCACDACRTPIPFVPEADW
ncbi:MAG: AAA family ATPase [Ktedonobacterales bacterium]